MGNTGDIISIFLQARLDSNRLPRKVLLPLCRKTVLEHAMIALRCVNAGNYVVLTDMESREELEPFARKCGFTIFAGDREDVLNRYADAARFYSSKLIVRATGDNPLVSSELAEKLIELHRHERADYGGFQGMPLGLGVETISADALFIAQREARDPYEREHVTPFLYRRKERFKIIRPTVEEEFFLPDERVTLDTEDDYRFITFIYNNLYDGSGPIHITRLIRWLKETQIRNYKESTLCTEAEYC